MLGLTCLVAHCFLVGWLAAKAGYNMVEKPRQTLCIFLGEAFLFVMYAVFTRFGL